MTHKIVTMQNRETRGKGERYNKQCVQSSVQIGFPRNGNVVCNYTLYENQTSVCRESGYK